ncbi:MAG TPA: GTPase [Candidatus Nanoarchaeia archaeon]|nr:GTPase [Candidatus Nanoarchaeia archaeon]
MKRVIKRVIISGAGGRDFHNYLVYFRRQPDFEVVAFTAAQIPGIEKRHFPKQLTRTRRKDILIYPEHMLPALIKKLHADYVYLAYSDLSHQFVAQFASRVLAAGANFGLLGTNDTYIVSKKPVIAVCAVRTGSGKSQTSRAIAEIFRKHGKKVVGVRHAMPYGNLMEERCQRFASSKDFAKFKTTIEEEEEYQPWIDHGFVVYSGFDYAEIVRQAEKEADVIVFDGGNNDIPFIKPDVHITVADPHRPGHETTYYPGFVNVLLADVIVINKVDSAKRADVDLVEKNVRAANPTAKIIRARSDLVVDHPEWIAGKRCALVGDGPTLSHGGMSFGAATVAVRLYGGKIVPVRAFAVGSIKKTFEKFPHLQHEIPAMGYGKKQIKELEQTINRVPCDVVIDGSPANLSRMMKINKPFVTVDYELGKDAMKELEKILKKRGIV